MEQGGNSTTPEEDKPPPQPLQTTTTTHHLSVPPGLTEDEFNQLKGFVTNFHTYHLTPTQCSSLLGNSTTPEEDKPPPQPLQTTTTTHHLSVPPGLTEDEFNQLKGFVTNFHTYHLTPSQCSSLLAQHIHAPVDVVWSVVRRFDKPQTYKHFIKSCHVSEGFTMEVGCTRDVNVISGLPAATSTERLDLLDDENHVMAFTIIGGEHRLRNYHAVTTVHEVVTAEDSRPVTVVLESYVVDVPEGNTEEDTRLFADTVVKLNLQKLASVTEAMAHDGGAAIRNLNLR